MDWLIPDFVRFHLVDLLGFAASAATLCAFAQTRMLSMRLSAIAANLCFIGYGALGLFYPVLLLHVVLLPLNIARLVQQFGIDATRQAGSETEQRQTLIEEWRRDRTRYSHAAANLAPDEPLGAANTQEIYDPVAVHRRAS